MNMAPTWVFLIIFFFFSGISISILKRKTPIHFFAGTTVDAKKITDVKKYNQANAILWFAYSSIFLISFLVGYFGEIETANYIAFLGIMGGTLPLILIYGLIENKYKK